MSNFPSLWGFRRPFRSFIPFFRKTFAPFSSANVPKLSVPWHAFCQKVLIIRASVSATLKSIFIFFWSPCSINIKVSLIRKQKVSIKFIVACLFLDGQTRDSQPKGFRRTPCSWKTEERVFRRTFQRLNIKELSSVQNRIQHRWSSNALHYPVLPEPFRRRAVL